MSPPASARLTYVGEGREGPRADLGGELPVEVSDGSCRGLFGVGAVRTVGIGHEGEPPSRPKQPGGLGEGQVGVDPVERRGRHDGVVCSRFVGRVLERGRSHPYIRRGREVPSGQPGEGGPRFKAVDRGPAPSEVPCRLTRAAPDLEDLSCGTEMAPCRQVGDGVGWVSGPRRVVDVGHVFEDRACLLARIGQPTRKGHVGKALVLRKTRLRRVIGHAREPTGSRVHRSGACLNMSDERSIG